MVYVNTYYIIMSKELDSFIEGWSKIISGGREHKLERREFSPEDFMREYDELSRRFAESHSTVDFKARYALMEKYGIDRDLYIKYARLYEMRHDTGINADGMEVGRVPAELVDGLLGRGDFSGALSAVRDGLSKEALDRLYFIPDRLSADMSPHTVETLSWMPEFALLGDDKASDMLLSCYGLYRDGDDYVVRVEKGAHMAMLYDSSYRSNFMPSLERICEQVRGTSLEVSKQETLRKLQAEDDRQIFEIRDSDFIISEVSSKSNRIQDVSRLSSSFFEEAMSKDGDETRSRGLGL